LGTLEEKASESSSPEKANGNYKNLRIFNLLAIKEEALNIKNEQKKRGGFQLKKKS
jgi:hypothetical protein